MVAPRSTSSKRVPARIDLTSSADPEVTARRTMKLITVAVPCAITNVRRGWPRPVVQEQEAEVVESDLHGEGDSAEEHRPGRIGRAGLGLKFTGG